MSFQLRPAKRENVRLLLGLAGGTGSGKTWSAMELAKGLAGDKRFAVVDTENGRASHYADEFAFDVVDLTAPFRPERYQGAIQACVDAGHHVILVDSMTHEWDGDGGLLEWHDQETGGREANNLKGWIKPKMAHRKFVTYLLQVDAHIILCFRAAERVEMVTNPETKRKEIVPKKSLTGLDGWVPIAEKSLPFELTLSCLLTADQPGYPKPIKLQEQHRHLLPLDRPINEETGKALASWAAGDAAPAAKDPAASALATELLDKADQLGARSTTASAINATRRQNATEPEKYVAWLRAQIARADEAIAALDAKAGADLFMDSDAESASTPPPTED